MASDFDRDNSVDRLLKGARRDRVTPPAEEQGPACLDAETLAAWADGGLDADRARLVETHVADCARCQALSATFFSVDEGGAASPATVVPFRAHGTNRLMYWLPIAAGTIAATLVIWLGIRGRNLPEPTSAMGDALIRETASPTPSAGLQQQGQQAAAAPAGRAEAGTAAESTRQRLDAVSPVELRAERPKQAAPPAALTRKAAEPVAPRAGNAAAMPPPPLPVPVVPPPTPTPTPTAVTSALGQTSAAGGGVARESMTFRSAAGAEVIAEFASSDPRASTISGLPAVTSGAAGGGSGGRGGGGGGRGAARVADIASSRPVVWRILSSNVVERTTDRVTWEAVTIAPPPVQGLLQGSSPSATVCWIVGRAGLVLLTTDGREFTRVTAPTTADLTSIRALDARQATVTTVDGQTFTTIDAGKTWK